LHACQTRAISAPSEVTVRAARHEALGVMMMAGVCLLPQAAAKMVAQELCAYCADAAARADSVPPPFGPCAPRLLLLQYPPREACVVHTVKAGGNCPRPSALEAAHAARDRLRRLGCGWRLCNARLVCATSALGLGSPLPHLRRDCATIGTCASRRTNSSVGWRRRITSSTTCCPLLVHSRPPALP
jgi:hypothetical protein